MNVSLFSKGLEKNVDIIRPIDDNFRIIHKCTIDQLSEQDKDFIERLILESGFYKVHAALAEGKEKLNILKIETLVEREIEKGVVEHIKRINFELVIDDISYKRYLDISFQTKVVCENLKMKEKFKLFGVGFLSGSVVTTLFFVTLL